MCAARRFFFFQAEDGIRDGTVTGVQTCALPIYPPAVPCWVPGILLPPDGAGAAMPAADGAGLAAVAGLAAKERCAVARLRCGTPGIAVPPEAPAAAVFALVEPVVSAAVGRPGIDVRVAGVSWPALCARLCAARTGFGSATCPRSAGRSAAPGSVLGAAGWPVSAGGVARADRGAAGACAGRR